MRILIMTNMFLPDELAGGALYSDLALFLKQRGHDIRVLCTFSYYPAWALRPEDRGVARRDEVWNGIPIRRVSMYVPAQPTGAKRLLSDLSFFGSLLRHRFRDGWRPEIVVATSPMFSDCLAQRFLYPGRRIPRVFSVQDFVVDAALELGILKAPLLASPLRWLERWCMRAASTLITISEPMLEKLHRIVGADRRHVLIPNWIHGSLQAGIDALTSVPPPRQRRLLFYSGNLGVKQGLPSFVDSFRTARSDWRLRIHGGGVELEKLRALADTGTIELGPILEEAPYIQALLSCTACLITQRPGIGANFLPSKLLPALATGTPVLAVCDASSPLGLEVSRGGFGEVVSPGDAEALSMVLKKWSEDDALLADYGRRARAWAEHYRRDYILSLYENELTLLVHGAGN